MGEASLGRKRSPETRERIRRGLLGHKLSLDHRQKLREAWLKRPPCSQETREKIHQARLGHKVSPETRKKISQAKLGHSVSPKTREKMRQARLRYIPLATMTSIERLLRDEFKKRRLKFEMHKTMFGRFQPDFVFEEARLIVEADGDYWHGRADVKTKDARFNAAASADGWSVWRFGEREIHMHTAACAKAVARFVRCH